MFHRYLIAFFSLLHLVAAEDLLPRPENHILDTQNWLSAEPKFLAELSSLSKNENVDAFVIIYDDNMTLLNEAQLSELGNAWSKNDWVIVSYNPSGIVPPQFITGGPNIASFPDVKWRETTQETFKTSLRHWTPQDRIKTSTIRLAELILVYNNAIALNKNTFLKSQYDYAVSQFLEGKKKRLLLYALIGILVVCFSLIGYFIYRRKTSHSRGYRFPPILCRERFGAPFSGGTDTQITFTPPQS